MLGAVILLNSGCHPDPETSGEGSSGLYQQMSSRSLAPRITVSNNPTYNPVFSRKTVQQNLIQIRDIII
jgi:hypothetical protein